MKFLKGLLVTFLILVIVGGLGYIGYSTFFMGDMNHGIMNSSTDNSQNNQMAGMGNNQNQQHGSQTSTNTAVTVNIVAVENRSKLNEAVNLINQAMDLITIDPYSKTTIPSSESIQGASQSAGNGTINIYPNGNNSLNITPNGTTGTTGNQSTGNMNNSPANNNYVYDQGKLQQLHNGIFALAQGNLTLSDLSDDLLAQSSVSYANYSQYQIYLTQYYAALQNKTKLDNALSMINQATTLININPYASQNGYSYNAEAMGQLHQGVYQLAQGMAILNQLSQSFTEQMSAASSGVYSLSNSYQMSAMTHGSGLSFLGNINAATVFNIILILFVIGLFAGIIGAILNLFKPKNGPDEVR